MSKSTSALLPVKSKKMYETAGSTLSSIASMPKIQLQYAEKYEYLD